ncbi:MAG TPA: aldehyde dehydrogenase family protein, partial [Nitrososphaeraceae archaeon]|nr:aldehyde dehydrogenase family protein [Nitrososphaeraceae archaeon]
SACSRVYVQKNKKNIFIEKLISKVTKINIDNPKNINSDLGPVINSAALKNFKKFVNIAKKDGKILYGGKIVDKGDFKYGNYVMPTIVTDLPEENILLKKELFLPILCIDEYDSFEEGLSKCNNSEYGLTAGIYSNDKEEINEFVNNIEAGVVYVNRQKSSTTGALVGNQSFGGWKNSGISGKGTGGKYYLIQFMREQSHTIIQTN